MPRTALILRSAFSLLLLTYLFLQVDIRPLAGLADRLRPAFYVLAVVALFGHLFLQSAILQRLLGGRGATLRTRDVFRVVTSSSFFGMFVPGAGGPDVVLCYNLARSGARPEDALSAVVFMRVAVLFVMVASAVACSFTPFVVNGRIRAVAGALLAGFLLFFALILSGRSRDAMARLFGFLERHRWTALLYRAYLGISAFGRDTRALRATAPLYLAGAFLKIFMDYLVARSLGLTIPFLYFALLVPLISLATLLPVSIGGLGVREGSYAGLFTLVGLQAADALAIALVSFTLILWQSLAGAIVYGLAGATIAVPGAADRPR